MKMRKRKGNYSSGRPAKMKIISDKVFGELYYNGAWEKEENLDSRFGAQKIKVVIEAHESQEILDIQREKYLSYQQQKDKFIRKIPKVLLNYYLNTYDDISSVIDIPEQINKENINERLIIKLIRINDIYFARNGCYGWLCDCAWDEEHGLCILLSESEPCIKDQDYLI